MNRGVITYKIFHFILVLDIKLPGNVTGLILNDAALNIHLGDHQLGGGRNTLDLFL